MDPNTATRKEFTAHLTGRTVPANASAEYRTMFIKLQKLLDLLAMQPNINQTYMTPAASKNKVYFMWDFVGRSLGNLAILDPALPASEMGEWEDVCGRTAMANELIKDKSGKLDMLVGGPSGIAFGSEIEQASADCVRS